MTKEQAVTILQKLWAYEKTGYSDHEIRDALDMAIASLRGEHKTHTCTSCAFFTKADDRYGRCDKKDAYDSFTRAKRQRACKLYESKKEADNEMSI